MTDYPEDRRRVRAMLAGDSAAFDAFFHDYFPKLYRFVLPRVAGNVEAARDVCQEVLTRAMRRINTYRGEASLFTWLCRFARNASADYWSARGRDAAVLVNADDDAVIRGALESLSGQVGDQPEAQCYVAELGRLVQMALDHLPGNYGDVLEWKYLDELSIAEIAMRLQMSSIAAQSLVQRARAAFRGAFAELETHLRGGA